MDPRLYLVVLLPLLLVAGTAIGHHGGSAEELSAVLVREGFTGTGALDGQVTSWQEDEVADIQVQEFHAVGENRTAEAELFTGVTGSFAERYMADRIAEIESIYTGRPAPYSGIPAREVDCPDRFHPDVMRWNGSRGRYIHYRMYADADRNPGVCTRSEIHYRVERMVAFCPGNGNLLEVIRFVPGEMSAEGDGSSMLRSIRCSPGSSRRS